MADSCMVSLNRHGPAEKPALGTSAARGYSALMAVRTRSKSTPKSLAIIQNWLAAAKRMYRQLLVKSFASSASSGSTLIVLIPTEPKNASALCEMSADRAPTSWGSAVISSSADPSAIRSGQNETKTPGCFEANQSSTFRVTPGKTVDRRITSCPWWKNSERSLKRSSTAFGSGFRCSSTGVPTTTTTTSASLTEDLSVEATKCPDSITRTSKSGAPASMNGIRPSLSARTAASSRSSAVTL